MDVQINFSVDAGANVDDGSYDGLHVHNMYSFDTGMVGELR